MSKKAARAVFSAVVIGGALTLLLAMTVRESAAYYKHVDEVMSSPEQWYDKKLKLHGFAEGVLRRTDSLDYRFNVTSGEYTVVATYTGIVPDTFKDGSEVVLEGRLGPDGFLVAPNGVMAKCPSKYEAAETPPTGPGR
jgi:cytochrome c-type biogenesis protein CcmE